MSFEELVKNINGLSESMENEDLKNKFMKKVGEKLRKKTLKKAMQSVNRDTGMYFKSIKRGKVYKYKENTSIRVYSTSNHAHLIEDGHIIYAKGNKKKKRLKRAIGIKKGKNVFKEAYKEFETEVEGELDGFLDKVIKDSGF